MTDLQHIVEFMARQPGMVERLLADHINDGTGHCRLCTEGAQAGRKTWPCPLLGYARAAATALNPTRQPAP